MANWVFTSDLHGHPPFYAALERLCAESHPQVVILGGDLSPHGTSAEGLRRQIQADHLHRRGRELRQQDPGTAGDVDEPTRLDVAEGADEALGDVVRVESGSLRETLGLARELNAHGAQVFHGLPPAFVWDFSSHSTDASRRSFPQKSSPAVRNAGAPKIPTARARSVCARSFALHSVDVACRSRSSAGSPRSRKSEPMVAGRGYLVLRMISADAGRVPDFSEVEEEVGQEWERRAADGALRAKLEELRARGIVRTADTLP